ncbi:MAG: LysM peptidoglycan-binding domain-containing protein [Actinomycetota bacterium]|nr:LysM peptidoglycan-binding domain-containing protein [Actinomycetota bacterium]
MAATLAPYTVIVPARLAGPRPTTQVYVRRRLLVALVFVFMVVVLWLGAGNVLANRGGAPASTSTVRPAASASLSNTPLSYTPLSYTVQPGDTMWSIAQRFHGSAPHVAYVDRLVALNGGASLAVGQSISLP